MVADEDDDEGEVEIAASEMDELEAELADLEKEMEGMQDEVDAADAVQRQESQPHSEQ